MLEESASNLGRVRVEEASRKQALGEMFVEAENQSSGSNVCGAES